MPFFVGFLAFSQPLFSEPETASASVPAVRFQLRPGECEPYVLGVPLKDPFQVEVRAEPFSPLPQELEEYSPGANITAADLTATITGGLYRQVDPLASELRAKLSSRVSPKKILYPFAGDDAVFLFDVFPDAELVVAMDDHPFFLEPGEFRPHPSVMSPKPHVVYFDLNSQKSLVSSLLAKLAARLPIQNIERVTAIRDGSRTHGLIEFTDKAGRKKKLLQIHALLDLAENIPFAITDLLRKNEFDLLFSRAAMAQFGTAEIDDRRPVTEYFLQFLRRGAHVLEGPDFLREKPLAFEILGEAIPANATSETIDTELPFGYADYLRSDSNSSPEWRTAWRRWIRLTRLP